MSDMIERVARAWRPIETAPRDGTEIVVYAPGGKFDLPDIYCRCAWREDAGFCVDELREPTMWVPAPPKEGT